MAKHKILEATVKFISLCKRGKNYQPVVYKSDEDQFEFNTLSKAGENFDEDGELLTLVYVPDNDDADGHSADPTVIKKMAYSCAQEGANIDVRHNMKAVPKTDAYLAQSFIVQKGDPRFKNWRDVNGRTVNTEGAWGAVIKLEAEELRANYRSGEWNGVSLCGPAKLLKVASDDDSVNEDEIVQKVLSRLARKSNNDNGDLDMDKKELVEVLAEQNKLLVKELAAALKPEAVKPEAAAGGADDGAPVLKKGKENDPEALKAHAEACEEYELRKSVNFNDPKAVRAYMKKLTDLRKSREDDDDDSEDEEDDGKSPRERELEKELERERTKGKGASRQPVAETKGDKKSKSNVNDGLLTKEQQDLVDLGQRIGRAYTAQRYGEAQAK